MKKKKSRNKVVGEWGGAKTDEVRNSITDKKVQRK
jgi:hypothetical protein